MGTDWYRWTELEIQPMIWMLASDTCSYRAPDVAQVGLGRQRDSQVGTYVLTVGGLRVSALVGVHANEHGMGASGVYYPKAPSRPKNGRPARGEGR